MHHALCCVAFVSALPSWQWQRKTKKNLSSIHSQTVVHFIGVKSHVSNSPQTFQNHLKLLINSKNIVLLHEVVVNEMQLPEKCKTQLGRKSWFQFVVEKRVKPTVKNIMHIQEKSCTTSIPNSLANAKHNAKHAASVFRKQPLKFLSINFGTKNLCTITQIPDVTPPVCSKSRAVHKEDIVVTKF